MNAYKLLKFLPIYIANFCLTATDILMAAFLVKYLTQRPIETPRSEDQMPTEVEVAKNETVTPAQVELSANQIKEKTDKQRVLDILYLEYCYGLPPYLKVKGLNFNEFFNWDTDYDDN